MLFALNESEDSSLKRTHSIMGLLERAECVHTDLIHQIKRLANTLLVDLSGSTNTMGNSQLGTVVSLNNVILGDFGPVSVIMVTYCPDFGWTKLSLNTGVTFSTLISHFNGFTCAPTSACIVAKG